MIAHRKFRGFAAVCFIFAIAAAPLYASVIFSNGTPNQTDSRRRMGALPR